MSPRTRHPDKDVQKALEEAMMAGADLEVRPKKGHAWGRLSCGRGGQHSCRMLIWCTPSNPHAHARDIRALTRKCPHNVVETEIDSQPDHPPAHAHAHD
jgi:hypothetical protein